MIFWEGRIKRKKEKKLWEYLHTVTLIVTKDADVLECMLSAALTVDEKRKTFD